MNKRKIAEQLIEIAEEIVKVGIDWVATLSVKDIMDEWINKDISNSKIFGEMKSKIVERLGLYEKGLARALGGGAVGDYINIKKQLLAAKDIDEFNYWLKELWAWGDKYGVKIEG